MAPQETMFGQLGFLPKGMRPQRAACIAQECEANVLDCLEIRLFGILRWELWLGRLIWCGEVAHGGSTETSRSVEPTSRGCKATAANACQEIRW